MSSSTPLRALLLCPLLLLSTHSWADNCDAISAQIEAKMRAGGLGDFRLLTQDAATAQGRVVGTCASGSKKIVYQVGDGKAGDGKAGDGKAGDSSAAHAAPTTPATPAPHRATKAPRQPLPGEMIIECKDGSEPVNGRCKK